MVFENEYENCKVAYSSEGKSRTMQTSDKIKQPTPSRSLRVISFYFSENKRKSDDSNDNLVAKTKRIFCLKCTDLVVLGLPWDLSEHRLHSYFEQFGELLMAMVSTSRQSFHQQCL